MAEIIKLLKFFDFYLIIDSIIHCLNTIFLYLNKF